MPLLLGLIVSLATAPLRLQPAGEGDLLGWLVSGPYPVGFDQDFLKGEGDAKPSEGKEWQFVAGDVRQGIDLKAHFHTDASGTAYCYTAVEVQSPIHARLRFGSDDGAKVYLNGSLIFNKDIKRGVKRDEETVPIDLKSGTNRLLFKIEQYDGGWGLMARIVDDQNQPIPHLTQVVDVEPERQDAYRIARKLAGKPGAFDLRALALYEGNTAKAKLFLERLRAKAAHPERLEARLRTIPGLMERAFDDGRRASDMLMLVTAQIQSLYNEARHPLLQWAQNPGPLEPGDPRNEDYVHVLNGGRYFAHADGHPFTPIGANHNPDWPELEESNPLGKTYDPARTERWFANLQAHGVNVIRLMVETPPSGNLEENVGTFRPEHVIWLDHVFEAARKHGVKLWITPYDTFWMSLRKETSPYWKENGGPIDQPIDFLTKREIMAAQKRRIKYLIDRYGNSGTVFAWEIMNEIDLWWNASPQQIKAWTDEMAAYIRSYEHQKWGRNHMLTLSLAEPEPKGLNADTAFRRKDLDFATMHLYLGASRGPKPGQAFQSGVDFAKGVEYARSQIHDNRPAMDGESGPIDNWIKDGPYDNEVFHEMSWQHLMAGGAGPGTRWPYRQPHTVSAGMLDTLKSMRAFCDEVDWTKLTGPEVHINLGGSEKSCAFGTNDGAIARILVNPSAGTKLTIDWKRQVHGPIRIRCFDVKAGRWLGPGTESLGSHGINIPAGISEVALWLAAG